MACSPSVTICSGLAKPARANARCVRTTSLGSSSIRSTLPRSRSIRTSGGDQLDPEPGAGAGARLHTDAPAHALHAAAHDGQPDPGARIALDPVQPMEHAEDRPMVLRVDPDAVVLHPEPAPAVA